MAEDPSNAPDRDAATVMRQRHEAFHVLAQECQECRRDIEPHWQFCAHCGIRLATQCPGCGHPLPHLPWVRMLADTAACRCHQPRPKAGGVLQERARPAPYAAACANHCVSRPEGRRARRVCRSVIAWAWCPERR